MTEDMIHWSSISYTIIETLGMVEFRPRRGAIVKQLTNSDLLEMLDIRIALECCALELAITNFADSDL